MFFQRSSQAFELPALDVYVTQLAEAIEGNNLKALEKLLLERRPLSHPDTNENILHFACLFGTIESFKLILEYLPKLDLYDLARSPNSRDKLLRTAISAGNFLPYDCLSFNKKLAKCDIDFITERMRQIFLYTPKVQSLEAKQIIAHRYPDLDPNSARYKNLMLAGQINHQVRKVRKLKSWTKPEVINKLSPEAEKKLTAERSKISPMYMEYKKGDVDHNCEIIAKHLPPEADANCFEFVAAGKYYAKTLGPEINAKVQPFKFKNSDHVFLMIGDPPDRVVCDPWADEDGLFCLEKEMPLYLKGYKRWEYRPDGKFGKLIGYLGTTILFNSNVHEVELYDLYPYEFDTSAPEVTCAREPVCAITQRKY